jgi:AcrR family transcriptional regulator
MPQERVVLSREKLAGAVGDRWSDEELNEAVALLTRTNGRFPAGVRTLPPELVKAIQRERLLAAMMSTVTEIGYRALTVQDVLSRAGVSRPTFYEQFDDKEDCFLAVFEASAAQLRERLEAAVAGAAGSDWRGRLRAGIRELVQFVAEEPEAARVLIVEGRASSPEGLRRRDELLDGVASRIDGLVRGELAEPPSALTAAGVVGGVESVLYARLQTGNTGELDSLVASLIYFVVLAYAGHEAAAGELNGTALG